MAIDLDSRTRLHGFRDDARNSDNRPSMHDAKGIDYGSDGSGRGGRLPSTPSLHASSAGVIGKVYDAATTLDARVGCKRKDREEKGGKDEESERTHSEGFNFRRRKEK